MNIEKNTQNAVAPMKDARQYKHTPSNRKRVVGKILALVGCFAVLLSCLLLPSSAIGISYGDSVPITYGIPWNMPSQITIPIYGREDLTAYLILDVPYANTNDYTQWYEDIYIQSNDSYRFTYNNAHNTLYNQLNVSFNNFQSYYDNPSYPLRLSYNRFNYTSADKYFLPGFDEVNSFKLNWTETDRLFEVEYDIGYLAVDDNGVGDYVRETLSYEVGSNAISVDLYTFFADIGLLDRNAYVEFLDINITIDDSNVFFAGYQTKYESNLMETPLYGIRYEQIVNSGSATSFIEFLEDTVGGFLGLNLFTFGVVNVTPGAILSVFGGVAILIWLLKLFLGG